MPLINKTWTGDPITGSITGFRTISTIDSSSTDETPVITPDDILARIREIKSFVTDEKTKTIVAALEEHLSSTDNPHHTTLSDLTDSVSEALYNRYVEEGGKLDLETYKQSLFKVLHVATSQELINGDDETALVSIGAMNQAITDHSNDPRAHREILSAMLPGEPIDIPPILAIDSRVGVPLGMVRENIDTDIIKSRAPYTYIGPDRALHTAALHELPVDYMYGEPLIPFFGTRINEIPYCNDFTHRVTSGIELGEYAKAIDETYTAATIQGDGPGMKEHSVTLSNVTLLADQSKTFSVFAKAGTCPYLCISFQDYFTNLKVQALFDLVKHTCIIINGVTRYTAEIVYLKNGWCRCALAMHSHYDIYSDIVMTFFKEKPADNQDYMFDGALDEKYGYLFGMQLENGGNMSPLIWNTGYTQARDGFYLFSNVDWIDDSFTMSVVAKTPKQQLESPNRTIASLLKNHEPVTGFYIKPNGATEIRHSVLINNTLPLVNTSTVFEADSKEFIRLATTISADATICAKDNTMYGYRTPEMFTIGDKLLVGHDRTFPLDSYVKQILIYPIKTTTENLKFLNGED
jgi:hypothetical protein